MFNREKFANILKNINELYENQTSFAKKAHLNRTYLSQYMNLKLDSPPSPKKLKGIADASRGITTYEELMEICGHVTENAFTNNSIVDHSIIVLPLFMIENEKLVQYSDLWIDKKILEYGHEYFAFKSNDDSMLPLVRYWGYCYNRKVRYLREWKYLFSFH
jgi:transcriptional regulator with XRE-family HTH domain